jgi:hypothetical protein
MLEVVLEYGFPLFIVERSPLLTRDMELLVEINRKSWVGVVFSISSLDPAIKRALEPRSPSVESRFEAMHAIAEAGITVGTSLMPIFPFIGDGEEHLEALVLATKESGGTFILAGGLTMQGVQAERTLEALLTLDSSLEARWRGLYHWPEGGEPKYSPPASYSSRIGLLVRELCSRHGMLDRMPRFIEPGPLAVNKRIAEQLFLKTYDLELEGASSHRIWAYRKAAWTVDELQESIAEVYQTDGVQGLEGLPSIGRGIAREVQHWIESDGQD